MRVIPGFDSFMVFMRLYFDSKKSKGKSSAQIKSSQFVFSPSVHAESVKTRVSYTVTLELKVSLQQDGDSCM